MLRRRLFVKDVGPSLQGFRSEYAYGNDATVLGLENFNGDVGQFDADAGLRNVLKVLKNQTVEGFGAIQRKVEAEHAVDVTQGA